MALWGQPEDDGALAANRRSRVALLQVDAGLRAAIPELERPLAERAVLVPCHELGPGQWRAGGPGGGGGGGTWARTEMRSPSWSSAGSARGRSPSPGGAARSCWARATCSVRGRAP